MAFESNYVTFIGNLTDDPELRHTQGGSAVVTASPRTGAGTTGTGSSRRRRPTST
jgi:single-stranded DNA-binding protein